jgi:tyrosine-protein kinase Etk/Wzc
MNINPKRMTNGQDADINFAMILGVLRDYSRFISHVIALFFVCSISFVIAANPIYRANAVLQVEKNLPSLPGLGDVARTLGGSTSSGAAEISLMTSRMVIGQATDILNLDVAVVPKRFPLVGDMIARRFSARHPGSLATPWLGLNSYDWGGAELLIDRLEVPDHLMARNLVLIAGERGAFTLLDDQGGILLQGQVGRLVEADGIRVQVRSLAANAGAIFSVSKSHRLATIASLQKNIQASERGKESGIFELAYESSDPVEAESVLSLVSELYVRQNRERSSVEAASSLKFVEEQLPKVRSELEKAQSALNDFQTRANMIDIGAQTKGLLDQIVAIESNIQQLRLQQVSARHSVTGEHPASRAIGQQIKQLQQQKAHMEKGVGALPDTQQELFRLTRDMEVSNQTYASLLNQAQQLEIAKAGTVGNARVIDQAAVDVTRPVKPAKALIVVVCTLLGGFLATAIVFIRELLNRGLEDPVAIEQLGLSVYGSIPYSEWQHGVASNQEGNAKGPDLMVTKAPADLASEALRSLRTSIHFFQMEASNNIIMVSSASPGVGKSFVSCNLAAVLAQAGQRVLLIDADLRRGLLHKTMDVEVGKFVGLSDFLMDKSKLENVVHKVAGVENLHFIGRGKVPPNPSELLMSVQFTNLLESMAATYDLVIIDVPPILAVTDAAIIGKRAGVNLLVARFGKSHGRDISLAMQRFHQSGVYLNGAIFNAVRKRAAGYYRYGYYEYGSTES